MFELNIKIQPRLLSSKYIEIETLFTINNDKTFCLKEILPDEFCKDKELLMRMIDKQFYETKKQIKKYLAIKD